MTRSSVVVGAGIVGLAFLTLYVLIVGLSQEGTAHIVSFQRAGNDADLVVVVGIGYCDQIADRSVAEDSTSVRITVRTRGTRGTCPAAIVYLPVTVALQHALGDRTVFDQSGTPIQDLGTWVPPSRPTPTPLFPTASP